MAKKKWNPGRLKKVRTELGMSPKDMAEKLDVDRQTIYNWEGGVTEPNGSLLAVLSNVTGKPMDWFYGAGR